MKLGIVGSGYVGVVTAACLADAGHDVTCVDVVQTKVDSLNRGVSPVFEPGLDEVLARVREAGRFRATTDLAASIRSTEAAFLCVGTPSAEDGSADLSCLLGAAEGIGGALRLGGPAFYTVIVKSTVPPGTSERVSQAIESASGRRAGEGFGVCMNPEFLKEGCAVQDFRAPDRIVIGAAGARERAVAKQAYSWTLAPLIETDLRTAEMIKYASNAFLATKVSFINEIANACERFGVDVYEVADGMGFDSRIGRKFLDAGAGWGGSCFGKDVKSLIHATESAGYAPVMLNATLAVNDAQPLRAVELAARELGSLRGKRIAVLGLAFKPGTDDVRDAPSLKVVRALIEGGAAVAAYDPKAEGNVRPLFAGAPVSFPGSARGAINGADACIILTEWKEFAELKAEDFSAMRTPLIIEGRKILAPDVIVKLRYRGIGRRSHG